MTTFINRMRGSGQTRPEGGAHAALGPARPVDRGIGVLMVAPAPAWALTAEASALAVSGLRTTVATSTIGSSS